MSTEPLNAHDCGFIAYALERWADENTDPHEASHLRELAELVYTRGLQLAPKTGEDAEPAGGAQ